jgi:hypothetical protein
MMIRGDRLLPEAMTVSSPLKELAIDPNKLLSLFDKVYPPRQKELAVLWSIINSPLTPDSLDGIWRCARSFKVRVKYPEDWIPYFRSGLFEPCIQGRGSIDARLFWAKKSLVYEHFINRQDVVAFESAWSEAIRVCFSGQSLVLKQASGDWETAGSEFFCGPEVFRL